VIRHYLSPDPDPEGAETDCPDCGGGAIVNDDGIYCPDCG
jgi:DNA-directed RNA polymerase subunit RPC12/RpoP